MATTDFVWGRIPLNPDGTITVKNTDSSNAFVAGNVVTFDASNPLSGTQPAPGAVLSTTDDLAAGVCIESIAKTAYGRVQVDGFVQVVATGSITANTMVEADTSGGVKTCASGKPAIGRALTAASNNGDLIWIQVVLNGKGA